MLPGIGGTAALALVDRQGAALRERFAARRDNQADADRLREAAARITDIDGLLRDRRTLRVVLESFQLESEIDKRATLRRVLTEDPSERTSLVNRLPDARWRALANAFAERRSVDLAPAAIAAASIEDIRRLDRARVAGLDFLQVSALTAPQVAALDPDRIAAISTEAIGGLEAGDVTALRAEQVAALTPPQLRALFLWQVAAIEPTDLAGLGTAQLRALSPTQVAALTAEQMGALSLDQLGAFTATQIGALDDAQLNALTPQGRAVLAAAPFVPDGEPQATPRRPLGDAALVDRILAGAITNRFEKAMGEANPGLREALYFRRMAAEVTTIAQLMSDRALLTVARGALGLPDSFAALSFEQQRDTLTRRLDLGRLRDEREVARMAARYLAQVQQPAPANPVLALFSGSGAAGLPALSARRVSFSA